MGHHDDITLDECKTKCLSDPTKKCKFIHYGREFTGTIWCYLNTAEQCADNERGSDPNYDIYQAVESPVATPVATPGNVITLL